MTKYDRHMTLISGILNEFNFDKVHRVMTFLNWTWGYEEIVPDVDTIRKSARERMDNAINGCLKECPPGVPFLASSGGLEATASKNEYGQIDYVGLNFVLTQWDEEI